ncbi:MAG: glycosyltransferase family 2 protein [Armatimonadota bacterium]|nr:glycosyltransferase family 2 protein [Armatimonadota bacterium]
MMADRYSVVIPTYNRRRTLLTVLDALARQDRPELVEEVVVVDDGSTDGTSEAVRGLQMPLTIRLLEGRRGGPAAARNAGVEAARGQRVLFLCDDIAAGPGLIAAHHARRSEAGGPCAVVGRIEWPPGKSISHFQAFVMEHYHFGFGSLAGREELPFHAFITANLSIERELLLRLGGFDEGFEYGWEDTDLGLRAEEAGVRILYAPEAVAYHHHEIDPGSYCRRQAAVGRSAAHFAQKHPDRPEVVGLNRLPRPWSPRWLLKGALFNRLMRPGWTTVAHALSAIGARRPAELVYSQVLAACYYGGMAEALREREA